MIKIKNVKLSGELITKLEILYNKIKIQNPNLAESDLLEFAIRDWLRSYEENIDKKVLRKDRVNMKNNLKQVIKYSGKTQKQIADEIGINATYLGQIIKGKYEPSLSVAQCNTHRCFFSQELRHW